MSETSRWRFDRRIPRAGAVLKREYEGRTIAVKVLVDGFEHQGRRYGSLSAIATFLTSINGQLVSSWSDNRISRGGVGLFADAGESAAFKWLSISERDSFWGRLAAHFSVVVFPSVPQQNR